MVVAASWRPDVSVQVAFNARANDPGSIRNWSDLSATMFTAATNTKRGRQYETNQNLVSQPTISYIDQNEYLNPANTSSPYAPGVTIYRDTIFQAMWPNGGTGNLLNTGAQAVSYDPSFEAYTAGTTPSWVTAVGGTSPVIGTTTPHAGTKDLTWTLAASATEQGASFPLPCIPGRQYTTTAYVRQSAADTQLLSVTDQNLGIDRFYRTTASGWGTADVGGAWTTSGGSAADYSTGIVTSGATSSGYAYQSHTATNTPHYATTGGASITDVDVRVSVSVPTFAIGAPIDAAILGRFTDANNYVRGEAQFAVSGFITVRLVKVIAGTPTVVATSTLTTPYDIGQVWHLRFSLVGTLGQVKAWPSGTPEPSTWAIAAAAGVTAAGAVGCYSLVETGNTDTLPLVFTFSGFSAVGGLPGTTTTTTGAYVRLALTWTATQPLHTLQVATPGLVAATGGNVVLVDDLQHEPGGSASAFTTSGPVIYGVWRGNTERWPAEWVADTLGFLGWANSVGVDMFAAFQKITLWTEIRNSILAKLPALYWPLSEASNSTTFGEVSGNSGVSLTALNSKLGAASTFTPGSANNVLGDVSGVGVAIATTGTANVPATVVQVGTSTGSGFFTLGFDVSPITGYTVSFVATHTTLTSGGGQEYMVWLGQVGNASPMIAVYGTDTPNKINFLFGAPISPYVSTTLSVTDSWADGKPHLYTMTLSGAPLLSQYSVHAYVDGVSVASGTISAVSVPSTLYTYFLLQVGGYINPTTLATNPSPPGGVYSHVALYSRALALSEVQDLASAAGGYLGESSGTRVARYLSYGWSGLSLIETGASIMGVSNLSAGTTTLAACQSVATTENGNFFVDSRGYTRFVARTTAYLTTTSRYTFGENTAGGELPYLEGIKFDFDPTLVYDTVNAANYQGPSVTVSSLDKALAYYPNTLTRPLNVQNAFEVYDCANYFLNNYGDPRQRVEQIVLDPIGNPNLWPVVLTLEIGMRVTVIRRPKAANAGAGLVMSQDYFILSVDHSNINMDPAAGTWRTTLLMYPVGLYQVGILDDPTYGLLDSTMILAY